MTADETARADFAREIDALIDRLGTGAVDDSARDDLLARLLRWQAKRVAPYAKLVAARGEGAALPTDVFRFARVAAHPPERDIRVFRTSGTSSGRRGEHPFADLSLYDRAARTVARSTLFADGAPRHIVSLVAPPSELPDSSLSYMVGRYADWFADRVDWVYRRGALESTALATALEAAETRGDPVVLLGTSFAFVHAEDVLARRFALPIGSRIMQTGGYKGRSRQVAPDALRARLARRYGIAETHIVSEYGMTELSSQMFEPIDASPRRYHVPGWMRVTALEPQTLEPLPDSEVGVLRIDDPANLDSVAAILTADLGQLDGRHLELLGRAPGALLRGCSLAVEDALR